MWLTLLLLLPPRQEKTLNCPDGANQFIYFFHLCTVNWITVKDWLPVNANKGANFIMVHPRDCKMFKLYTFVLFHIYWFEEVYSNGENVIGISTFRFNFHYISLNCIYKYANQFFMKWKCWKWFHFYAFSTIELSPSCLHSFRINFIFILVWIFVSEGIWTGCNLVIASKQTISYHSEKLKA